MQRGRRLKNAAIVEINLNSLAEAQKARHIVRAIAEHSNTICFAVTSAEGEARPAAVWIGMGGRPRTLRDAFVTADRYQAGTVVCVHAKDMKEPWCLAASTTTDTAKQLMTTYGKRWGIESGFRDTKDQRFGMGMASIRVSTPERRDRLWLLNAFAVVLLTLLGAAGEALGYDRHLKSNTSKQRTHSLFRQGAML